MNYGYKPTTNGRSLLAACAATEKPLRLTRVAVGSGMVPEDVNLADVHELYQYVTEGAVAERRHKNDRLYLTIQYSNRFQPELPTFGLSEFIVYAEHPETGEETDLLYATLGDYTQPVPAYRADMPASVFNFPLVLIISDEIEVSVVAAPGIVTYDDLPALVDEGIFKDAITAAVQNALDAMAEQGAIVNKDTVKTIVQDVFDAMVEQGAIIDQDAIETAVQTAFDTLVAQGTVVDANKVQQLINAAIAGAGGTYIGSLVLTLPVAGWVAAEVPTEEYAYICDVAAENVTAQQFPVGGPNLGSFTAAQDAGVVGGCETLDGYVRFYAMRVPAADIMATITLFGEAPGTAITQDMLGSGLVIDANGKLAVDIPADDEAAAAIESVFNT